MAAGGFALTMAFQSVLVVAAAPQQHSQTKASALTAPQSHTSNAPVSQGHLFGKFVSATARTIPAGPQHGMLISAFATSANPGHTRHAGGHGHASNAGR